MFNEKFMNVTLKDFDEFKRELMQKDKRGVCHIVDLQKFSYAKTRLLLSTGVDSAGTKLTDKEIEFTKLILKQIVSNLKSLKVEHSYSKNLD